ncbi:MAG: P63C domain-containing protein [Nitrospirae bacterium]|nr:P63C domain-containing protein [Nitrospirota bacterium]
MEQMKDESKVKGAMARAEKLSADQRKEISRKAATSRWHSDIPAANYTGTLSIADTQIPCAIYDNGDRVLRLIVQREVVGLLTMNKKGDLDRYLQAQNLQPYIPEKFKNKSLEQATFLLKINGKRAFCYEGEDIVDICKMYWNARKAGNVLLPNQQQLADRAEVIITALAKTGIVGLIDEATGYQQIRAKDALQAYLSSILLKELAAWVRRFPEEFFIEIYRLNGWDYTGTHFRPSIIGKYIKDIIYERLGPGVLAELEKINPKNEKGHRHSQHHRWLTEDVGHPMLAQHLYAVIGLMRISKTWKEFKSLISRAYPKSGDQLSLF